MSQEAAGEIAVEGFRAQGVAEIYKEGKIRLGWEKPVQFYRALSFLREALSVGESDTVT